MIITRPRPDFDFVPCAHVRDEKTEVLKRFQKSTYGVRKLRRKYFSVFVFCFDFRKQLCVKNPIPNYLNIKRSRCVQAYRVYDFVTSSCIQSGRWEVRDVSQPN